MKISTKGHYGIRFVLDLATNASGGFVSINDIAERQGLSEKYLWQIVAPLKSRGILQVARGVTGGYKLARPANAITVRELVESLEGKIVFAEQGKEDAASKDPTRRVARELWNSLAKNFAATMDAITLQDLVEQRRTLAATPSDYSI